MARNIPAEWLVCDGQGAVVSTHLYRSDAWQAAKKACAAHAGSSHAVYKREVTFTSRVVVDDDQPKAAEAEA